MRSPEASSSRGESLHLAGRAVGIFKPRQMSAALSIKTVMPRPGRQTWYRDQEAQSDTATGLVPYDLARGGLADPSNRHLKVAFERNAPLIYLRATAPAIYEAIWPVWVEYFRLEEQRVLLAAPDIAHGSVSSVRAVTLDNPDLAIETEYSFRRARHRNHQAWFSSRTKSAYGYRCALSGLPLRDLLVGAHIVPDAEGGPASVTNGICMSTLHHAAFDTHLIGIDPGLRVHLSPRVTKGRDGPLLESLKTLEGASLRVPQDRRAHPNPDYLERRFHQFRNAVG